MHIHKFNVHNCAHAVSSQWFANIFYVLQFFKPYITPYYTVQLMCAPVTLVQSNWTFHCQIIYGTVIKAYAHRMCTPKNICMEFITHLDFNRKRRIKHFLKLHCQSFCEDKWITDSLVNHSPAFFWSSSTSLKLAVLVKK